MAHNHDHSVKNYNKAFALGVTLNVIFVVIEAFYGFAADSLALVADAGHNLSDVLGLLIAWGASVLATKSPTEKRTYGFRRVTILASLSSAILLLVALGGIAFEAFERLASPQPVEGMVIIIVAAIGVVINTATAMLFVSGQKRDLNIKGAFLHMSADAAVSLGVVIAGIVILQTGWLIIDPLLSIIIVILILIGSWGLLRDSVNLSIDAVPKNINVPDIQQYLSDIKCVTQIHDLHVWALSTTETALTVHLVTNQKSIDNNFLRNIQKKLHDKFHIDHPTIQIELEDSENNCHLDRSECI
jgi:cobalt-zinc-cadmium efflux system protein